MLLHICYHTFSIKPCPAIHDPYSWLPLPMSVNRYEQTYIVMSWEIGDRDEMNNIMNSPSHNNMNWSPFLQYLLTSDIF